MYVFYIDSFLLYHSILTICIIQFIKKITGIQTSFRSMLFGNVLNNVFLGFLVWKKIFTCRGWWELSYASVQLLSMMFIFRMKSLRRLLQVIFFYLIGACLMGGIIGMLHTYVSQYSSAMFSISIGMVLVADAGMETGRKLLMRAQLSRSLKRKVILKNKGHCVEVEALYDTGNSLQDILTGEPVHIVSRQTAYDLGKRFDKTGNLSGEGARLIPYRTIGQTSGLMIVFRIDTMEIYSGKQKKKMEKPLLGIGNGLTKEQDVPLILNCQTEQTLCLK